MEYKNITSINLIDLETTFTKTTDSDRGMLIKAKGYANEADYRY